MFRDAAPTLGAWLIQDICVFAHLLPSRDMPLIQKSVDSLGTPIALSKMHLYEQSTSS